MSSSRPRLFPSIRNPQRNQLVDVLRGLSILLVLFSHLEFLDRIWSNGRWHPFGRDLGDVRGGMGYYGVVVFFVLSGFLITQVTLRRYGELNRIDCSAFWWMRFARIMPLLLAALFAMVVFHYLPIYRFHFADSSLLWRNVGGALSFRFYDVLEQPGNLQSWNPLWSLSVEEVFYLVFPFACLAINGRAAALWLGIVAIATGLYLRVAGQSQPFEPTGCVDYLALGCLLARCRPERWRERLSSAVAAAIGGSCGILGVGLIFLAVLCAHPWATAWATFVCASGGALVLVSAHLLRVPPAAKVILLPISVLGVVSYELYLLHLPVAVLLAPLWARASWQILVVVVVASVLTHELFSEPMNRSLRELGKGGTSEPARRAQLRRKCVVLPAGAAALILAAGLPARSHYHRVAVEFRIAKLADLPAGSGEPLIYTGKPNAGDLLYLYHDVGGKVALGVDHWGFGGPKSQSFSAADLTGGTFLVQFGSTGVVVSYEGREILRNPQACFDTNLGPVGTDDIGFSTASAKAVSTIVGFHED